MRRMRHSSREKSSNIRTDMTHAKRNRAEDQLKRGLFDFLSSSGELTVTVGIPLAPRAVASYILTWEYKWKQRDRKYTVTFLASKL